MAAPKGTKPPRAGMGRPKGSQNKATADVKLLAGKYGPAAIEKAARMAGLIIDPKTKLPDGKAESETAQMQALNTILDRAYGKAAQPVTGGDEDDSPIRMVQEIVLRGVRSDAGH